VVVIAKLLYILFGKYIFQN